MTCKYCTNQADNANNLCWECSQKWFIEQSGLCIPIENNQIIPKKRRLRLVGYFYKMKNKKQL